MILFARFICTEEHESTSTIKAGKSEVLAMPLRRCIDTYDFLYAFETFTQSMEGYDKYLPSTAPLRNAEQEFLRFCALFPQIIGNAFELTTSKTTATCSVCNTQIIHDSIPMMEHRIRLPCETIFEKDENRNVQYFIDRHLATETSFDVPCKDANCNGQLTFRETTAISAPYVAMMIPVNAADGNSSAKASSLEEIATTEASVQLSCTYKGTHLELLSIIAYENPHHYCAKLLDPTDNREAYWICDDKDISISCSENTNKSSVEGQCELVFFRVKLGLEGDNDRKRSLDDSLIVDELSSSSSSNDSNISKKPNNTTTAAVSTSSSTLSSSSSSLVVTLSTCDTVNAFLDDHALSYPSAAHMLNHPAIRSMIIKTVSKRSDVIRVLPYAFELDGFTITIELFLVEMNPGLRLKFSLSVRYTRPPGSEPAKDSAYLRFTFLNWDGDTNWDWLVVPRPDKKPKKTSRSDYDSECKAHDFATTEYQYLNLKPDDELKVVVDTGIRHVFDIALHVLSGIT